MLIFIDDLQWADKTSLELFNYLSNNLTDEYIMLVGVYRKGYRIKNTFGSVIEDLENKKFVKHLDLKPLDKKNIKNIIEEKISTSISGNTLDLIQKVTEGNPLFAIEIANEVLQINGNDYKLSLEKISLDLPDRLTDILERKLVHLEEKEVSILRIGSVIGENISLSLLDEVTNIEKMKLIKIMNKYIDLNILEFDPEEELFKFKHNVFHLYIYNNIPSPLKKDLHREIAESIEELYVDEIEDYYFDLSNHYKISKDFEKAYEFSLKAAERAEQFFAHEEALNKYKESLRLHDKANIDDEKRLDIQEKLGDIYKIIGDYQKSIDWYERIKENNENKHHIRAFRKLGSVYEEQGRYDKALFQIDKALNLELEEKHEEILIHYRKGKILCKKGELEKAKREFSKALEIIKFSEDETSMYADIHYALGSLYLRTSIYKGAMKHLKRSLNYEDKSSNLPRKAAILNKLGNLYFKKGDLSKSLELFKKSLSIWEKIGKNREIAKLKLNIGTLYLKKSEFNRAKKNYHQSLEIFENIDHVKGMCLSLINQGDYYLLKEEEQKALEKYDRGLDLSIDKDYENGIVLGNLRKGLAFDIKGDRKKAKNHYSKSIEKCQTVLGKNPMIPIAEYLIKKNKMDEEIIKEAESKMKFRTDSSVETEVNSCQKILNEIYLDHLNSDFTEDEKSTMSINNSPPFGKINDLQNISIGEIFI